MVLKQDYYIFSNDTSDTAINMLENHLSKDLSHFRIFNGKTLIKNERNRLGRGWGPTIIISVISLLYGIINVINIELFNFMKRKNTYAILLAYGATYFKVLMAVFFESSILALASSVLTYILVYLVHLSTLIYVIPMKVDALFLIITLCIGQLYSLLYAMYVTGKLKKQQISDYLRNNL